MESIQVVLDIKNNFLDPSGSEMGRIYMPSSNHAKSIQSDKAQTHDNQSMKRSKDIFEILKKISKLSIKNIKTMSQKKKVDETFSPS